VGLLGKRTFEQANRGMNYSNKNTEEPNHLIKQVNDAEPPADELISKKSDSEASSSLKNTKVIKYPQRRSNKNLSYE
jgi:hypothetical protein